MKPKKLRKLTDEAFRHYLQYKDIKKFTPKLIKRLEKRWRKLAELENDYRTGEETYGYGNNIEDNLFHVDCYMQHISDRWECAFRIRWLLDGLASGKISNALTLVDIDLQT